MIKVSWMSVSTVVDVRVYVVDVRVVDVRV